MSLVTNFVRPRIAAWPGERAETRFCDRRGCRRSQNLASAHPRAHKLVRSRVAAWASERAETRFCDRRHPRRSQNLASARPRARVVVPETEDLPDLRPVIESLREPASATQNSMGSLIKPAREAQLGVAALLTSGKRAPPKTGQIHHETQGLVWLSQRALLGLSCSGLPENVAQSSCVSPAPFIMTSRPCSQFSTEQRVRILLTTFGFQS